MSNGRASASFLSSITVCLQDRFEHVVPILNKLGNTTVGLTLMLIGVLGIIESRQHQQETTEQLQPVLADGTVIQGNATQMQSRQHARLQFPTYASALLPSCIATCAMLQFDDHLFTVKWA